MKIFLCLAVIFSSGIASCDDHSENILTGTQWKSIGDGDLMVFTSSKVKSYSYAYFDSCYAHWTSCYSVIGDLLTVDVMCWGEEINRAKFRISNDTLYTTNVSEDDPDPETYAYVAFEFVESDLNLCEYQSAQPEKPDQLFVEYRVFLHYVIIIQLL